MDDEQRIKHQETLEYWQGFPEAPFSDTFKWIDGAGFEHMTTCRGWSGSGLYSAISKMIALVGETGGRPVNQRPPMAPPPAQDINAKLAAEEGNEEMAKNFQAAADDVPPHSSGKPWLKMEINRIVIKPEPGDKYTLECYAPGHKWPDLKAAKRDLNIIAGYIKHITTAEANKPQDLTVNAIAYYLEGKPKDNGNGFWLDLYHLRLK